MSAQWLQWAIQNNMDLYDAQARSWSLPCQRTADAWWSMAPIRPYYSNLVSSGPQPDALIQQLDAQLSTLWSIKDAHNDYDLTPFGFTTLFDACWVARPPQQVSGPIAAADSDVHQVSDGDEFSTWVQAWGETPANESIFEPNLLNDPDVLLLYTKVDDEVLGGLCANFSGPALGISNTFGSQDGLDRCLALLVQQYPDHVLVGYERAEELQHLLSHGFTTLGELRVWIRERSD